MIESLIIYLLFHNSLFSVSRGFDIILVLYSNNRYELEMKYTSMVDINSRGTLPRVDMTPLATYLNVLEQEKENKKVTQEKEEKKIDNTEAESECESDLHWHCNRITDSGPILRLESKSLHLTKAERYGHPYERPIYSSLITPKEMTAIVLSFFSHAYLSGKVKPKKDHEWDELHAFNRAIDWNTWCPPEFR
jgi:hypothetical protein